MPVYPDLLNGPAFAGTDSGTAMDGDTTRGHGTRHDRRHQPPVRRLGDQLQLHRSGTGEQPGFQTALSGLGVGNVDVLGRQRSPVPEPGTFVLLAAGAVCGGLAWRCRAARRKRLAANLNSSIGVVGCAAQARGENDSSGEGRARENFGPAGFLTKSFNKGYQAFTSNLKEHVMKVARIFGIALALLVTAMVAQSRADVVEYYLMPIVSGSTPYTTSYSADGSDNITANSVSTSAASGTIYFDVYAGLTQTNTSHTDDGIQLCYTSFLTTGTIGNVPTSLSLTRPTASTPPHGATDGHIHGPQPDGNRTSVQPSQQPDGVGLFSARLPGRGLRGPGRGPPRIGRTSCSASSHTATAPPLLRRARP